MLIDSYSEQGTKLNSSRENRYVKANELSGRVRCAYFLYIANGAVASGQVLGLTKLPSNSRLVGGYIYSAGADTNANLSIGLQGADGSGFINADNTIPDSGAGSVLANSLNIDTTGRYDLLESSALGFELDKECWVVGTLDTAGMSDGDQFEGVIFYVTD